MPFVKSRVEALLVSYCYCFVEVVGEMLIATGVLGGMAVSLFSKPLTLLIGLLIVGVQVCFLFPRYPLLNISTLPSTPTSS
jgi:hypothetical protein